MFCIKVIVTYFAVLSAISHGIPVISPRCSLPEIQPIIWKYTQMINKPEQIARYNYYQLYDRTYPNPDPSKQFELELLQDWVLNVVKPEISILVEMVKKRSDLKEINIAKFENETAELTVRELNKAGEYLLKVMDDINIGPVAEEQVRGIYKEMPDYTRAMLNTTNWQEKISMANLLLEYLQTVQNPMQCNPLAYNDLLFDKKNVSANATH